jgi:hypothetical protein
MALCREHDLPPNREKVQSAWQELIRNQLDLLGRNKAARLGGIEQLLSLYFTGGGALSLPCVALDFLDNGTLKVTTPERELIFFPLSQVRNYALTPFRSLPEAAAQDEPEDEPEDKPGEESGEEPEDAPEKQKAPLL